MSQTYSVSIAAANTEHGHRAAATAGKRSYTALFSVVERGAITVDPGCGITFEYIGGAWMSRHAGRESMVCP